MADDFAHMAPSEKSVWQVFLRKYGPQWTRFEYDVHVGLGHPIDPNAPDWLKTMIQKISPKRIDVVGWKGITPTIFEVSPIASRALIGALFMYKYLFQQQFPHILDVDLAAVVPRIDPDMARYLAARFVTVYLVDWMPPT